MKKNLIQANSVLKQTIILLITTIIILSTITVTANTNKTKNIESMVDKPVQISREILFEDSFETYEDFTLEFPPWTCIDVDGQITWGHSTINFPHENEPYAFMVFNPSMTTPPFTDPAAQPHTGAKYVVCWSVQNTLQNDDWLITPLLGPADYDEVSFWAKSFSNQYQLKRFEVGISTTDTNPSNFTIISPPPYVIPPYEAWTQYTYNLDNYDNQAIYIGVHCVSYDSWFFMLDDFQVSGTAQAPEPKICCEGNLLWEKVKTGSTVNATFKVCNCGDEGSFLNWQFASAPSWPGAIFEIEPDSGVMLAKGDCVIVTVNVTAPAEKNKAFSGKIKMINSDNSSDFCEVDVSLTTPRARIGFNLLEWILQKYPNMFPILRHILA